MEVQTRIEQLRAVKDRIAANELDEALETLMDLLRDTDEEAHDECVTLYRRYHAAENDRRLQLVSHENYSLAVNNVSYGLLRLCTRQIHQWRAFAGESTGLAVSDAQPPPAAGGEVRGLIARGVAAYQSDDYAGAVAAFEEALANDPLAATAAFFLGVIREEIGDDAAAIDFYDKAIAADPVFAAAYNNRGARHVLADRYEPALLDLNRALELDPRLTAANLNRASVYMVLEEYALALEDLNACARAGVSLAEVFRLRSLTRLNLGDYQGAIDDAERGVKLNPGDAYLRFSHGMALFNLDRFREAIRLFNQALERNPEHYESLRMRAVAYCLIDDFTAARPDLDTLLAARPDDDQGFFWLGYLLQETGDPAGAIRAYSRAAELNPHNKVAFFNRGLLAFQHGHYKEALPDFRMAHDLDPQWDLVPPYIRQTEEKLKGGFWKKWLG